MKKTMMILRGVSGSGKSTYAQRVMSRLGRMFHYTTVKCSADDFFMVKGEYKFNPRMLGRAHEFSKDKARKALRGGIDLVVIDNTNTQAWEYEPYVTMAKDNGYRVVFRVIGKFDSVSLDLYATRNTHGVPREAINRMASRFEKV
jgi:predicted kinase